MERGEELMEGGKEGGKGLISHSVQTETHPFTFRGSNAHKEREQILKGRSLFNS